MEVKIGDIVINPLAVNAFQSNVRTHCHSCGAPLQLRQYGGGYDMRGNPMVTQSLKCPNKGFLNYIFYSHTNQTIDPDGTVWDEYAGY